MKRTLIIVVVLLACVLILFMLGVGVGLNRQTSDSKADPDESSLSVIADLFGGRRALDLDDVDAGGGAARGGSQPGVYRLQDTLRLEIAKRSTPMRLAKLSVISGACAVDVTPHDENSVKISGKTLSVGDALDLNIPGKGAEIVLTPLGQQPTRVRIEPVEP